VKKIQKGMWEVSGGGTEAAECSVREGEGEGADGRMQVAPYAGREEEGRRCGACSSRPPPGTPAARRAPIDRLVGSCWRGEKKGREREQLMLKTINAD
jgi:hypothetical protein